MFCKRTVSADFRVNRSKNMEKLIAYGKHPDQEIRRKSLYLFVSKMTYIEEIICISILFRFVVFFCTFTLTLLSTTSQKFRDTFLKTMEASPILF